MSWAKLAEAGVVPMPKGPPPAFPDFAAVFGGAAAAPVASTEVVSGGARAGSACKSRCIAPTEKRSAKVMDPGPRGHHGGGSRGPQAAGGKLPGARPAPM
jgi:hypothetical protein